jgi:hypothetical protein
MLLRFQTDSLKNTTPAEWVKRFLFGGTVTVLASLIDRKWGPVVGGLFLAFPGIFPPSASLVEKHKIEREGKEGKQGVRLARAEASVEATGASIGALGLAAFAGVLWWRLPAHGAVSSLGMALAAWAVVSWCGWWVRERM